MSSPLVPKKVSGVVVALARCNLLLQARCFVGLPKPSLPPRATPVCGPLICSTPPCSPSPAPELHLQFPRFSPFGGSMELMAVPKKKVTPHKKRLRNAPKALKPVPVIVRCKACGRVKLPHFYCCSGNRAQNEKSDTSRP